MKFASSSAVLAVSTLFCSLGAVQGKKHGLRRVLHTYEERQKIANECSGYFSDMDVDGDGVLSLNDIKNVLAFLVDEAGMEESKARTFAHDLSNADTNDDYQIDKLEFMNACTVVDCDVSDVMKTHSEARKKLAAAAEAMEEDGAKKEKREESGKKLLAAIKKSAETKLAEKNHEKAKEEAHWKAHVEHKKNLEKAAEMLQLANDHKKAKEEAHLKAHMEHEQLVNDQKKAMEEAHLKAHMEHEQLANDHEKAVEEAHLEAHMEHKKAEEESQEKKLLKETLLKAATAAIERAEEKEAEEKEEAEKKEVVPNKYSEALFTECMEFFELMDIDGDGELSIDDLETVVDRKVKQHVDETELREFVDTIGQADLNNDDVISNDEFMSACLHD